MFRLFFFVLFFFSCFFVLESGVVESDESLGV